MLQYFGVEGEVVGTGQGQQQEHGRETGTDHDSDGQLFLQKALKGSKLHWQLPYIDVAHSGERSPFTVCLSKQAFFDFLAEDGVRQDFRAPYVTGVERYFSSPSA
jgi:hypothetical protein